MGYYIIIKRKGAKAWLGAIPARKGVSVSKLRVLARRQVKPGFTYRIITAAQLKRLLMKMGKRGVIRRKVARRKKARKKRSKKKR